MVEPSANQYLHDAVMTASAEQLQLMLYDGAIRFAAQARDAITTGDIEACHNLLTRTQRIVTEMENGLQHDIAPELCSRMAGLYGFVFGELVDANIHKDLEALDDALRILKMQRETWAMLVEKVQQARAQHDGKLPQDQEPPPSTAHSSISLEG